MNYRHLICTIIVILINLPTLSQAKEGFGDSKNIPSQIAKAQNSVFLVQTPVGLGSAFLVGEDKEFYYFATNNHVVKNVCVNDGLCLGVGLYQFPTLDVPSGNLTVDGLVFNLVTVARPYDKMDIAILKVSRGTLVPFQGSGEKSKRMEVLKFSETHPKKGDVVYTIGFPGLDSRTCKGHSPIKDQQQIYKRWSQGIYLGAFKADPDSGGNLMATTVDMIAGNSGGPLLNDKGEILGVITYSVGHPQNCYLGNENPATFSMHSSAVIWH